MALSDKLDHASMKVKLCSILRVALSIPLYILRREFCMWLFFFLVSFIIFCFFVSFILLIFFVLFMFLFFLFFIVFFYLK